MGTGRLEAFSDGVMAIIITIMVLELKVPAGASLTALVAVAPILGAYALSFTMIGIFWNNHHHMMQATRRVDGRVLWANLLLLFWMSLIPFDVRWIGETGFQPLPVAAFGVVFTLCGVGYLLLEWAIIAADPANEALAAAVGADPKAKLSLALDIVAVAMAFVRPWIAIAIYVFIALMWFVPDRRVEMRFKA